MTSSNRLRALVAVTLLVAPFALHAQSNAAALRPPSPDTTPRPAANPADVSSPDAILKALYDVISGPAGQKRDWNRFKSLVVPNGRFIPTVKGPNGAASARVMSADDYATASGPGLERNGFFERQIATKTEE